MADGDVSTKEAKEAVRSFHKQQEDEDKRHRLLVTCPVFRIMSGYAMDEGGNLRGYRRLDELEVVRCRFGTAQVLLMDNYFQRYFASPQLTKLRLQVGLEPKDTIGPKRTQLDALCAVLRHHSRSLKTVDLSRNNLDGPSLAEALGDKGLGAASSTALQVLDISFNDAIGDDGASVVMTSVENNAYLKAVIMKGCNVGDEGAVAISQFLRGRPTPKSHDNEALSFDVMKGKHTFHINLNENRVGAPGTKAIGYGLPEFVSVSVCGQHVKPSVPTHPYRGKRGGRGKRPRSPEKKKK